MKATSEEIIAAYRETGSVWKAGQRLGMAGQSVHERLRALGYPIFGRNWTEEEITALRSMVGQMTIGKIAHELGRTYTGTAAKISELGIGVRFGNQGKVKIPRGAGYDKASCQKYIREIERSNVSIHTFARRKALGLEPLVKSLQRHFPDWWKQYIQTHSKLPEALCAYCSRPFFPMTKKQVYCDRQCASDRRQDIAYFGGKRRRTIGLAERQCQLCGRTDAKALSSHHVLGKDNDPENEILIALCMGCHQIVGILAGRKFLHDNEGWESLIQLVEWRRRGSDPPPGLHVTVEVDVMTQEDVDEESEIEESGIALPLFNPVSGEPIA